MFCLAPWMLFGSEQAQWASGGRLRGPGGRACAGHPAKGMFLIQFRRGAAADLAIVRIAAADSGGDSFPDSAAICLAKVPAFLA